MMNWKLILVLLVVGFSQMGCMCLTNKVSDHIKDYAQVTTEFERSTNVFHLYTGCNAGFVTNSSNHGKMPFMEYRFPNVLCGGGSRILQVYIPVNTGFPARVSESTEQGGTMGDAFLVIMGSAENRNPAKYLMRRFPEFDPTGLGTATIVLSKPYTLEEMDHFLFIARPILGGQVEWSKIPADIDIQWIVRSRMKLYALRCQYIYTVPLDIITFPIQFVIVNMKMARWVRASN